MRSPWPNWLQGRTQPRTRTSGPVGRTDFNELKPRSTLCHSIRRLPARTAASTPPSSAPVVRPAEHEQSTFSSQQRRARTRSRSTRETLPTSTPSTPLSRSYPSRWTEPICRSALRCVSSLGHRRHRHHRLRRHTPRAAQPGHTVPVRAVRFEAALRRVAHRSRLHGLTSARTNQPPPATTPRPATGVHAARPCHRRQSTSSDRSESRPRVPLVRLRTVGGQPCL